jgi:hypothetical protein
LDFWLLPKTEREVVVLWGKWPLLGANESHLIMNNAEHKMVVDLTAFILSLGSLRYPKDQDMDWDQIELWRAGKRRRWCQRSWDVRGARGS